MTYSSSPPVPLPPASGNCANPRISSTARPFSPHEKQRNRRSSCLARIAITRRCVAAISLAVVAAAMTTTTAPSLWGVAAFSCLHPSRRRVAIGTETLGNRGQPPRRRTLLDRREICRRRVDRTSSEMAVSSTVSLDPGASGNFFDDDNLQRNRQNHYNLNPVQRKQRQAQYEEMRMRASTDREEASRADSNSNSRHRGDGDAAGGGGGVPSVWSFDSLFPAPMWDDATVRRDLYDVREREGKILENRRQRSDGGTATTRQGTSTSTNEARSKAAGTVSGIATGSSTLSSPAAETVSRRADEEKARSSADEEAKRASSVQHRVGLVAGTSSDLPYGAAPRGKNVVTSTTKSLSRMVEDRVYGMRRSTSGEAYYDTSLLSQDSAVQFRDGVRLGRALKVNVDLLAHEGKRLARKNRLDEAADVYRQAVELDPTDGRGYLGLSRIAQRRKKIRAARDYLRLGIARARHYDHPEGGTGTPSSTKNPFLLQALGTLEEKIGHLSEAEALYIAAARTQPSHAAAWVALGQLRTRKLRQGPNAGRVCFRTAEGELRRAGLPPSSYVYTAWAAMEYKKAGDVKTARSLFEKALDVDPKCSAALLQLGCMEADRGNWDEARECFERVLSYDQRNSRVLQAYAIMESKRPGGDSREVIDLFERALRVNKRDAGVLQAYALFVAKLGDIESARDLLKRGTSVNKKHAAAWQAWGVLETRLGSADEARDIFQQGIWACAQSSGNQSGGRHCARLWQAWGVLEAREGDHEAARRCFGRALDADSRNVATVTAWTQMEESLGHIMDARSIFERALRQFSSPASDDKMSLWRAYELMETRGGNAKAAQNVYQRSMQESIAVRDYKTPDSSPESRLPMGASRKDTREVDVVSWKGGMEGSMGKGEVWMNNGSIEGRVPSHRMKKKGVRTLSSSNRNQRKENFYTEEERLSP